MLKLHLFNLLWISCEQWSLSIMKLAVDQLLTFAVKVLTIKLCVMCDLS